MEALLGAYDAIAAGSARVALVVAADALVPGPGTSYEERAGAGAAAVVLVSEGGQASLPARVTRTHPFLDRYRSDADDGTRDLYDARLFREEIFLPVVQEVGEQLASLEIDEWSLPDPDGRLGATAARKLGGGAPASASVYAAIGDTGAEEMLGLLGARCVDCGTINTPPTIHPYCISCGSTKFMLVSLARRGVVHTFVVNHTMPPPFEAPLPLAVIDLADGARVMLQAIGDGSDMRIGAEVELVLRRYAFERGVPVYGFKARGVGDATGVVAPSDDPKSSEE